MAAVTVASYGSDGRGSPAIGDAAIVISPNGRHDYDWGNKEFVDSDIEDWKPEGFGEKKPLNCDKWDGDSLKWFVYWMAVCRVRTTVCSLGTSP